MISIRLKDGSIRSYDKEIRGTDVALSLSNHLKKEAVAIQVNDELKDLSCLIPDQANVNILTRDDPLALDILRHDAAHIMAEAVYELYPDTQATIGPTIDHGFYYDFFRKESFTPEDLVKIEERMHEIVQRNTPIERIEMPREEAIDFFQKRQELFKVEIIESIPPGESITLYRQGGFIDLCRGPHSPSTGCLGKGFKLMSLAGSYWRGNHKNPRLTRIYGTAWASEKQLKAYLTQLEEAEKRDHRRLGTDLDLFHIQEEAKGSIFWHPKGWSLYKTIESFMRKKLEREGYREVKTPQIVDSSLWQASGHWDKFRDNMFVVESEDKQMAIKPMNCPCHVQIFKQGIKSYRDLPLRMAEFGACHRYEPSGALHGLMRVRAFVQDDAHIFCTPDQIVSETKKFCDLLKEVYRAFGFQNIRIKFSDRPENRAGSDESWDKAESALREAALAAGLDFTINPGEGAFYGPKLEFVLQDAIGRDWQCGTLQVDFILPERLDAHYIEEDGKKHRPVMLHRAILGSFERFIGILIEHYEGRFPLWLAPTQVAIATITTGADPYAEEITKTLQKLGIRVEIDKRNEKIAYKVRELSLKKIPLILVLGAREVENRTVSLRHLGGNSNETLALEEVIRFIIEEAKEPSLSMVS